MADVKGDPAKQPPGCTPVFTPDAPGSHHGTWSQCPNLKEVSSPTDFDGETYACTVCGERYRLYYEDMA